MPSPPNPEVRALIHERAVDCVVSGESIECELVLVVHPAILNCVPKPLPRIKTNACVIGAKGGFEYDLDREVENAREVFGVEPTTYALPASRLMSSLIRVPELAGLDSVIPPPQETPPQPHEPGEAGCSPGQRLWVCTSSETGGSGGPNAPVGAGLGGLGWCLRVCKKANVELYVHIHGYPFSRCLLSPFLRVGGRADCNLPSSVS